MTDVVYRCCLHCKGCPTREGHPAPCTECGQPLRLTADQLVARAMNSEASGGGVNADQRMFPAKDAPTDGPGPSGVPAPPPVIPWSGDAAHRRAPRWRWWDPLGLIGQVAR